MNINTWKQYLLNEAPEKSAPVEIGFETASLLTYDKTVRKQKYILNSIREIEGVRIVNVVTPTEKNPAGAQVVGILIKHTPTSGKENYENFLRQSIIKIKGVDSVRFIKTNKVYL